MRDITFRNAPDDKPYREVIYTGYPIWMLGIVVVGLLLPAWRRKRKSASPRRHS